MLTIAVLHTGVSVVGARTMGDALRIRVVARRHEIAVEGTRTVLIGEAAQVGPAGRKGIGTWNLGHRRGAEEDLDRVRTAALGPRIPRAWDVAVGAVGGVNQGRGTTPALCDASATNWHRTLGTEAGAARRTSTVFDSRPSVSLRSTGRGTPGDGVVVARHGRTVEHSGRVLIGRAAV